MTNDNDSCCCGGYTPEDERKIKDAVRERYARAITSPGREGSCCSCGDDKSLAEMAGYSATDLEGLSCTSFGCGNPVTLAGLMEGEVILDIGSGAGLDVFLAARKVGPTGKAIGLDMTQEMIDEANENAGKADIKNAEFRLGDAENMPVENESIDLIISNCVINLSPDKGRVFSECHRVLKPGGRVMISDMVAEEIPQEIRDNKAAWCACIAGAMKEYDYMKAMYDAGLRDIEIVSRKDYDAQELRSILGSCCSGEEAELAADCTERMAGKVSSITVHAVKKKPGGC